MNRLQQSRRQQIGYVYKAQVNNNVATTNYGRKTSAIAQQQSFNQKLDDLKVPEMKGDDMEGDGFTDIVKKAYETGKKGAKFLYDNRGKIIEGAKMAEKAYTSETGTALRNLVPDSDDTARPGFSGEKHAILQLKNGKYGVGNYIGPGTNLRARLERGDPPRTEVDKVAMAHDIRYALAKTIDDVRKADNIMNTKVADIARNRGDAPQNIAQARLIRAKVIGEDLGLLRKDAFSGDLSTKEVSDKDKILLMSKLAGLSHSGYGLTLPGGGMLPGDALKLKLLKQMAKGKSKKLKGAGQSRRIDGQSRSKDLGKNYKLLGSGLTLPGGGKGNITEFIVGKIIPSLMKSVNIPQGTIPNSVLVNIIGKSLDMSKSGNLPSIIAQLSKTLLPMITAAKVKSMSGSGYVGSGRMLQGRGINQILGKHKDMLLGHMSKGLFEAFKMYLNSQSKKAGKGIVFSGSGKHKGGSFWEGFKKGFKMVFKPGAKVLGSVATAMGQPEFGIPLGIVADAL